MTITHETVLMTPELARQILSQNGPLLTGNRVIRPAHVERFVGIIRRGEWKLTSQGISISVTGRLLNGQHRLRAIVETGIACWIVIAYNEPDENFSALDTDMAIRNAADYLRAAKPVAQIASFMAALAITGGKSPSRAQIEAAYGVFRYDAEAIHAACGSARRRFSAAPIMAAAVLRHMRGDTDYACTLWRNLILMKFEELPPIGLAFIKQVKNSSGRISTTNTFDYFARGLMVFDPARKNVNRVQVTVPELLISEARAYVRKQLGLRDTTTNTNTNNVNSAKPTKLNRLTPEVVSEKLWPDTHA